MRNNKEYNSLIQRRMQHFKTANEKDSESRYKTSIFGVLYVLLKDEETDASHSIIIHLILYFLEFMEFMIFTFQPMMINLWGNDKIADWISTFFHIPNIVHYINDSSEAAYLAVLYSFIFLVLIVIVNAFYVYYCFRRKYFTYTWPLYVLKSIARIICTVLFFPFFGKKFL